MECTTPLSGDLMVPDSVFAPSTVADIFSNEAK